MRWLKYLTVLAIVLAGCAQPPQQQLPLPTITVDASVQPPAPSLPGFEDGEPRPLASVTGEDGTQAEFVANELWLATDDEAELEAFLSRWQGTVLRTFDPQGLNGLKPQYLVRINAAAADPATLGEDLRKLDPNATGDHKVSSREGLRLLAAGAGEAASGTSVGLNWVGSGAQFRDRTSLEAPSGRALAGIAYNPDAFTWPSHSSGANSVQNIGVAEAWRALDLAGKLNNRVKLAILDMGFQNDADWRGGWLAISNVPLVNPIGTKNLLWCGGGSDCSWHGTNAFSAAMAVPDNRYGSSGEVTLSLAQSYGLPQGCQNGQIAEWDGSKWLCGNDDVGTGGGGGDITAVIAGEGLTGGSESSSVTLGVAFAGSGSATTVSRSDHDHFGQTWVGSDVSGLTVINTRDIAFTSAILGCSGAGSNFDDGPGVAGVWGDGERGAGVLGTNVTGVGVFGVSSDYMGVFGRSQSFAGVYGQTRSGNGVVGISDEGPAGVRGYSRGGVGLWGMAQNGFGVYGRSEISAGVRGVSDGNISVYGITAGAGQSGVRGETAGTKLGYGVSGFSVSGIGVYGESTNNAGVLGRSSTSNAAFFTGGSGGTGRCYYNGGANWTCTSDKNAKENFQPIDTAQILERLVAMPITTWTMKGDLNGTPHLGPTAQDFYAAFGLGDDDTTINTADAHGVALAAIQGLNRKLEAENRLLRAQLASLEQRLAALERLATSEDQAGTR